MRQAVLGLLFRAALAGDLQLLLRAEILEILGVHIERPDMAIAGVAQPAGAQLMPIRISGILSWGRQTSGL